VTHVLDKCRQRVASLAHGSVEMMMMMMIKMNLMPPAAEHSTKGRPTNVLLVVLLLQIHVPPSRALSLSLVLFLSLLVRKGGVGVLLCGQPGARVLLQRDQLSPLNNPKDVMRHCMIFPFSEFAAAPRCAGLDHWTGCDEKRGRPDQMSCVQPCPSPHPFELFVPVVEAPRLCYHHLTPSLP
jgi:hypothetical protein